MKKRRPVWEALLVLCLRLIAGGAASLDSAEFLGILGRCPQV